MPFLALSRATLAAAVITACAIFVHSVSPTTANASATGQLIRIGPLDPAWSFATAGPSFALLYSTKDQRDSVAEGSGALYVPPGLAPPGGWPLVVWAHGTVGIGDACAPSRQPQPGPVSTYLDQILRSGYAVLAPEYQGLGTGGRFSYYNATVEGWSILDAVAAIRSAAVPLSKKWVIIGQSEGAHAAMSAASLYGGASSGPAAGLNGVIATGLRTNPSNSLRQEFKPTSTGSTFQIAVMAYDLASLQDLYPDRVTPYLSDFGKDYVASANTECLLELVARADGRRPADLVTNPDQPTPTFAADMDALASYREDHFTADIMIGYGTADITVPPTDTEDYGKTLQQRNPGIHVTVKKYQDKDHGGAFLASAPDALAFLDTHLPH
ncbi:MAG: alpha/beta hydrolase [Mycobacterium sp.]|nr:alpha/beta hydrolase [Mycobacterium sp.]